MPRENPENGWLFPATRAKVGHIVDNTIYEPHTNAVEKIGLNLREFGALRSATYVFDAMGRQRNGCVDFGKASWPQQHQTIDDLRAHF